MDPLHDLPDRLILASGSPRRHAMLKALGLAVDVMPADLDDASLPPRATAPVRWALAMAWFKAARVAMRIRGRNGEAAPREPRAPSIILAADTVCDLDGRIIGKPRGADECRSMLREIAERAHRVHTAICLLEIDEGGWPGRRWIGADSATVQLGAIRDEEIDRYAGSGEWAGKAGGYNYSERLEAGWPLRCDGDPATVMGLPLKRLATWLERFAAPRRAKGVAASSGRAAACGERTCACR